MIYLGIGLLVLMLILMIVAIASPPEQLVKWMTGSGKKDKNER